MRSFDVLKSSALRNVLVYVFFVAVFSFYFFLDTFVSIDDQFFNIRFAELIRSQGLGLLQDVDWFSQVEPAPWISNILFYLSLIPFTYIVPLELGIKVYAVLSAAFFFWVLYYFFSVVRVHRATLLTFLSAALLFSPMYLARLLNARAYVLAPSILLLELAFLIQGRYRAAGLVSFLYFFWHSSTFFLPLIIAVAYFIFIASVEGKKNRFLLLGPLVGMVSAFILSAAFLPGFLQAFIKLLTTVSGIVLSTSITKTSVIREPIEVYPIGIFEMYTRAPLIVGLCLFFFSYEAQKWWRWFRLKVAERKCADVIPDAGSGALFGLSFAFLLGSLVTRRMLDFFGLFALAFVGYALILFAREKGWSLGRNMLISVFLIGILGLTSSTLDQADGIASTQSHKPLEQVSQWFTDNTEPGEIVYNPTMNFFPVFFFYNGGYNRFIIGMEPRAFYEHDARKYWLWYNLSDLGIICPQSQCNMELALRSTLMSQDEGRWQAENAPTAARIIREEFNTRHILTSKDFSSFNILLADENIFEKMYETPGTGHYQIYRIKE